MEPLNQLVESFALRNWYAVVALALTLAIQVVRKIPALKNLLWSWVPDGAKFLVPLLAGGVAAFIGAFSEGLGWREALWKAVGGALAIGVPSMGFAALLKESPLPWDGRSGGRIPPTDRSAPTTRGGGGGSGSGILKIGPAAAVFLILLSCGGPPPSLAPTPGLVCAPTPAEIEAAVLEVVSDPDANGFDSGLHELIEDLVDEHGIDAVFCAAKVVAEAQTDPEVRRRALAFVALADALRAGLGALEEPKEETAPPEPAGPPAEAGVGGSAPALTAGDAS